SSVRAPATCRCTSIPCSDDSARAGPMTSSASFGDTEISHEQKFKLNQWMDTQLANHTISAPHILAERKFTDVDFLKIDMDGPDLRVLQSFDGLFGKLGILAARLEVCMFGGAGETVNSFHNTDRFMREQGYCLFRLDNRTYSNRALPSPFLYDFPA